MLDHNSLVRSAYELEPLPPSVGRLARILGEPEPDPREITEAVSLDPVLTAKVLRMANSAAGAAVRAVTRVQDAVIRLGPGVIFTLAVGCRARPLLEQRIPGYGLSAGELWRHSVLSALSAEAARTVCKTPIPSAAYTAALLHDLGKLVVGRFLTPEDRALLERAVAEAGTDAADAEVEILSLHHGEVSAVIAQHWQLPDGIVQGVHYHHHPQEGQQTICYVTYLANVVAHTVAAGEPLPAQDRKHLNATMECLGLTANGFERLCTKVAGGFEQVSARYS